MPAIGQDMDDIVYSSASMGRQSLRGGPRRVGNPVTVLEHSHKSQGLWSLEVYAVVGIVVQVLFYGIPQADTTGILSEFCVLFHLVAWPLCLAWILFSWIILASMAVLVITGLVFLVAWYADKVVRTT